MARLGIVDVDGPRSVRFSSGFVQPTNPPSPLTGTVLGVSETDTARNITPLIVFSGSGSPGIPADVTAGPAATEIVAWDQGIDSFTRMSNAQLDQLVSKGIKALVLDQGDLQLRGWSSDPNATFDSNDGRTASTYNTARKIVYGNATGTTTGNGNFVDRCHARGIRVYLGAYWVNRTRNAAYGALIFPWHDTASFTAYAAPGGALYDFCAFASAQGFDGIAFDNEPYPNASGSAPTWDWDSSDRSGSEATVRANAKAAGILVGAAIGAFGLEVIEYMSSNAFVSHGWFDDVVTDLGGVPYDGDYGLYIVHDDFWEGILSNAGIPEVTFADASLYKSTNKSGATDKAANQYNNGSGIAEMSHRSTMWQVRANKVQIVPDRWIDKGDPAGTGGYEALLSPSAAATLLDNDHDTVAKRIVLYGHRFADGNADDVILNGTSYDALLQSFNTPETVDTSAPTITNIGQSRAGSTVTLTCRAADNNGIRAVRYQLFESNAVTVRSTTWPSMTYNRNGGTYATHFDSAYVDCTYDITSATASLYVIITAFSTLGQQHSERVALA